ncbi:MAG: EcsC family protein [Ornithinibacter sp.]
MTDPRDQTNPTSDAATDRRTALERASDLTEDAGVLGNQAIRVVESVLDVGIDGRGWFHSAAEVADAALEAHGGDHDEAVKAVVRNHVLMGGAEGFVTSLGGFVTLPIALPVNVLSFYVLATRMTAAVAHLRGYDTDQQQIRSAVLLTLVGADADDLLAKAGMAAPSGGLTNLAAQRLPGPAAMVVRKGVGFRLLASVGKNLFTRFGRAVPVVGGVIGGGIDAWMLHRVADTAREEFPPASRPASA